MASTKRVSAASAKPRKGANWPQSEQGYFVLKVATTHVRSHICKERTSRKHGAHVFPSTPYSTEVYHPQPAKIGEMPLLDPFFGSNQQNLAPRPYCPRQPILSGRVPAPNFHGPKGFAPLAVEILTFPARFRSTRNVWLTTDMRISGKTPAQRPASFSLYAQRPSAGLPT